jgi:hypothetical protein
MKKVQKVLAMVMSFAFILGATIPAQAATTEVEIEIKETTMDGVSVTIPSKLPIVFEEDGTNTIPTNWTIENQSIIAGIHLAKVEWHAGDTSWKVLSSDYDVKSMPVDSLALQFLVGLEGSEKFIEPLDGDRNPDGEVLFEANEITIPSGETKVLSFDVNRGAFTQAMEASRAFDLMFEFQFN